MNKKRLFIGIASLSFVFPMVSCGQEKYDLINEEEYQNVFNFLADSNNYSLRKTYDYIDNYTNVTGSSFGSTVEEKHYVKTLEEDIEQYTNDYKYYHFKKKVATVIYSDGVYNSSETRTRKGFISNITGKKVHYNYEKEQYEESKIMITNLGLSAIIVGQEKSLSAYSIDKTNNLYYTMNVVSKEGETDKTSYKAYGFKNKRFSKYIEWVSYGKYSDLDKIKEEYITHIEIELYDYNETSIEVPKEAIGILNVQ